MTWNADSPLLVFADDWGRHPSSCQHLVGRLLDRHRTVWVNTIGMRTPHFDFETLRRGLGKIRQWALPSGRPAERWPTNLTVLNPRMWPWCGTRFGRFLNRRLLARQITPALRDLPTPPVAVTTIPITADLMGALPVRRWVYYCVDDFSHWPGLDQDTLRKLEEEVVRRADVIITVSDTLRERIARMGRDSHLLTHGVDPDFWETTSGDPLPVVAGLERPLVVFWGVVDRRMDLEFLRQLSTDLGRGTIVVAGPENDPGPAIRGIPRVALVGSLPFAHLPRLAQEAAVLVMPYADLPVTRAIQPLKLKEYLAAGQPVVVRDLPANRDWADCLDLAATPEEFSRAVRLRIETGVPADQRAARARLAAESWAGKVAAFAELVFGPVSTPAACPS